MDKEEFDAMLYKSIQDNFYLDISIGAGEVIVKLKMYLPVSICRYGGSETVLETSVRVGD